MRTLFLTLAAAVHAKKCLFIGHSFLAPVVRRIPAFVPSELNHTQQVISRGGENGIPSSLWNSYATRLQIQAVLDRGDVDLLAMPIDRASAWNDVDDFTSTEYIRYWINYALSQNSHTEFMIGIPWSDFPGRDNTTVYASRYRSGIPTLLDAFAELDRQYPGVTISTNPYGLGVVELRLLFENGALPDVSFLTGPARDSIFRDEKGHAGMITDDLLALFFINRIYGVDLRTSGIDLPYQTDLKAVAQSVLDAFDAGDFCNGSSCYHGAPEASSGSGDATPASLATSATMQFRDVGRSYRLSGCCPHHPNHDPCAIVHILNGPVSGFTCEEVRALGCPVNGRVEWDPCELCYGEVHTPGVCVQVPA